MATEVRGLVNSQDGLIDRTHLNDEEIYRQELEQIFARSWLFLCHESQVGQPGTSSPPTWERTRCWSCATPQVRLGAFLNVCRHRGNRVCRADAGNASAFVCAYHGWTYGTDGKLIAVPSLKEAYYDELDTSKWGLSQWPSWRCTRAWCSPPSTRRLRPCWTTWGGYLVLGQLL